MLEHEGVPIAALASNVVDYINEGYTLTIQEIADHLSVSYDYVRTRIVKDVSHIVLTSYAKQACFKFYGDQEHLIDYFKKRLLISRSDYMDYILEKGSVVKKEQQLFIYDLPLEIRETFESIPSKKAKTWLKKLLNDCLPPFEIKEEEQVEQLEMYPEHLVSNKEIINGAVRPLHFNYDIEVARYIAKFGIPKIKINNTLIRYRLEDIKHIDKIVAVFPLTIKKKKLMEDLKERYEKEPI